MVQKKAVYDLEKSASRPTYLFPLGLDTMAFYQNLFPASLEGSSARI